MCVWLLPTTCSFGRMTGIFYVLLRQPSGRTVDPAEENSPTAPAELEPGTFRSRVRRSNH